MNNLKSKQEIRIKLKKKARIKLESEIADLSARLESEKKKKRSC